MQTAVDITDIIEATRIDSFAISTKTKSCIKAISVTNIDIVKPIPANRDTKNKDTQLVFLGFSVI